MKNNIPCEVVKDLFPSYIDTLTSEVTNHIVEEHIAECEDCKEVLRVMKEPSNEEINIEDKKEIDFLKKNRKKNKKVVVGCMLASVVLVAIILFVKFFLIGTYLSREAVAYQIEVEGKNLYINGYVIDSYHGISNVKFEEKDGVVMIRFYGVKKNMFHMGEFRTEYKAKNNIKQICVDNRIIWANGKQISDITSDVYNTRHPYIGDASKNNTTLIALDMNIGNFKNELQTSTTPYGWKMILEDNITSDEMISKEVRMKSYAYVLIAVIDNLDEVTYECMVDNKKQIVKVTKEDATRFIEKDIKEVGKDISLLQELIEKAGIQ